MVASAATATAAPGNVLGSIATRHGRKCAIAESVSGYMRFYWTVARKTVGRHRDYVNQQGPGAVVIVPGANADMKLKIDNSIATATGWEK
jgi:hypothetical protein